MGMGAAAVGPYHHYTFELFALDTKLTLGADANHSDVMKAMDGHILMKGVLVGRFHRLLGTVALQHRVTQEYIRGRLTLHT